MTVAVKATHVAAIDLPHLDGILKVKTSSSILRVQVGRQPKKQLNHASLYNLRCVSGMKYAY